MTIVGSLSSENASTFDSLEPALKLLPWPALIPALIYAIAVHASVYQDVLGDIDLSQMAAGITHGALTGLHERGGFHYGLPFSFGYYFALYHFAPYQVLSNSTALIHLINTIGEVSAVAAVAICGLYLTRLYGLRAAILATSIFALSPLYLEQGTSGHPEAPALCCLLLGAYLLTFALPVRSTGLKPLWRALAATGAAAMLAAALCVRSDVVLALPFIAMAGGAGEKAPLAQMRTALLRLAPIVTAFLVFHILQKIVLRTADTSGEQQLMQYLSFSDDLRAAGKGLIIIILGTGIATSLMCAAILLIARLRRLATAEILAIGSLIVLSLVLWLPNPAPARHFLFLSLAASLIIGLSFARRARLATVLTLAALVPIVNQSLAELSYRTVVAHYDWMYPAETQRRITRAVPLGFFSRNHAATQLAFSHLRAEGIELAQACKQYGRLLVFADEPYYFLMALSEVVPDVRLDFGVFESAYVITADSTSCHTAIVSKYHAWPRDVVPDVLSDPSFADWPAYYQESTRGKWDKADIPSQRRVILTVPDSATTGSFVTAAPSHAAGHR